MPKGFQLNSYEQNVYNMFQRWGYAPKYEHAGIYCIKIDNILVYIGKSHNMLERISQHYVGIQKESESKYRILAEAQRKGHNINFDVLYYATSRTRFDTIEEIGEMEGELIRKYRPALNTQIPKAENWRKYTHNRTVQKVTLADILGPSQPKSETQTL